MSWLQANEMVINSTAGHKTNEQVSVRNDNKANIQIFCVPVYIFFILQVKCRFFLLLSHPCQANLGASICVQKVSCCLITLHFDFPKQNFQQITGII